MSKILSMYPNGNTRHHRTSETMPSTMAYSSGMNATTLNKPDAIVHLACRPHTWCRSHGRASAMIAIGRLTNATMLPNRWMLPLSSLVPSAQFVFGNATTRNRPADHRASAIDPADRHFASPLWISTPRIASDPTASSSTATSNTGR